MCAVTVFARRSAWQGEGAGFKELCPPQRAEQASADAEAILHLARRSWAFPKGPMRPVKV
ncbi:hypothetical protein DENIT_140040 [Pseudomonas veronii]|nr:hypothetical protein DENIT_140040 [Pseudomonas veronii]